MAVTRHVNDSVPLVVGGLYRLGNSTQGCDWIQITSMDFNNVYAKGVGNHIADLVIPRYRFDDLVPDGGS